MRVVEHMPPDTAQDEPCEARSVPAPDNDEIGVPRHRSVDDCRARATLDDLAVGVLAGLAQPLGIVFKVVANLAPERALTIGDDLYRVRVDRQVHCLGPDVRDAVDRHKSRHHAEEMRAQLNVFEGEVRTGRRVVGDDAPIDLV